MKHVSSLAVGVIVGQDRTGQNRKGDGYGYVTRRSRRQLKLQESADQSRNLGDGEVKASKNEAECKLLLEIWRSEVDGKEDDE
ncbi:hypothetical protein TWF281_001820 [Arthrobotrys megalospora]